MKNFLKLLLLILITIPCISYGQANLLNAKDPADIGKKDYVQTRQDEDKKLEYGYVDERDIMFSKVIWEVIDLDQRVNFPYLYPIDTTMVGKERRPLIHFLIQGMKNGKINLVYDDGKFNEKITYNDFISNETKFQGLTYREINNKGKDYVDIQGGRNSVISINNISLGEEYDNIIDLDEFVSVLEYESEFDDSKKDEIKNYENTRDEALMDWLEENFGEKFVTTYSFTYDMIDHYRIKGVWYFDKRISELKYRPLALAPVARQVINKKDDAQVSNIEDLSKPVEMFWVYYPDARDVLKNSFAFSDKNSVVRKSFDELINARRFQTMIYLEENMYEDREVKDYVPNNAFMRLLESQRIKEKIRNFEHDMWSW